MKLTREELARGRKLLQESFRCPWHYKQYEIECSTCEGGTTSVCNGKEWVDCPNPECDGTHVPCTFVESPDEYPAYPDSPQVVATIDVPGLSTLAEKNGECICWLRNQAEDLINDAELLLNLREALVFIGHHDPAWACTAVTAARMETILDYAKSLGWRKDPS